MPVPALVDADLATRHFSVRARDVVFVKGVLEASEGVGVLFGERGGDLVLATPKSRLGELDRVLADLRSELGGVLETSTVLEKTVLEGPTVVEAAPSQALGGERAASGVDPS